MAFPPDGIVLCPSDGAKSQSEIASDKRISQHLSEPEHLVLQDDEHIC